MLLDAATIRAMRASLKTPASAIIYRKHKIKTRKFLAEIWFKKVTF
jgi:hypothetical protein